MAAGGLAARAADNLTAAAAVASITTDELKIHVDVLADDTFEGREAGSRGGRAAGNYLLKAFEKLELKPAGDAGSYVQSFGSSSRNILGLIEGSDPELKDQIVVLGAHYDHVGYGRATNSYGPWGYIHNGADDNASGIAGLLEIADALKRLPVPPRRSVLLACWDGEESGLLGSRHWTSWPTLPLARVACAINMDMIGRMQDGRLEVLGTRTGLGLRRLVSVANEERAATLDFSWQLKADSDHWPFYERRIPVLMFHTGLHGDYHRPSDDAHRINHAGLASVTRVAFQTVVQLADAEQAPAFREAVRRESSLGQHWLEQPTSPQPPRFGLPYRV
jgi:Zn-dependent M28 family amino/carboxypeptidase